MASSDKIRVIIVDDIAETRENIRKLLQFENDVEVIGVARTGREGLDLTKETKPDVVLMDINMPDMDGITATESIQRLVPFTKIIILSVQSDPNYMRRAMLAGARDFLTKPPSVEELTAAIRRQGTLAREERAKAATSFTAQAPGGIGQAATTASSVMYGKIVVVYSPKGGTGVTTTATNLAMSLHNDETPVILVDGNLQFGDVGVFLNQQSKYSIVDLAPRADELDPEIVDGVLIKHNASGVKVLPAPTRPEYAENVSGEQFGKVLKFLCRMFSYVVVDTSSSLTDITLAAIDSSDVLVLLTTQDIPSLKNSRLFLDLTDMLGIERQRILFTMNRFDKRIGITPERISENFKQDIVAVIPLDERVVVPSVNRGLPLMLGDKSKPIARSFLALTESIRQRITEVGVRSETPVSPRIKVSGGKK
jgi:pilus assembly protein CpaE